MGDSNLLAEIEQYAGGHYIYGDQAYPLSQHLLCPFKGPVLTLRQKKFNKKMGKLRVSVEWAFRDILVNFAFLDFKKNQKVLWQPLGQQCSVTALLTNCHTCLYGNVCCRNFSCPPPGLEEYLY